MMATVPVITGKLGKVARYKIGDVADQHRHWMLGKFVTDENGVPITEAFEIKYHHANAGEERSDWSSDAQGCAITFVVSGSLESTMAPDGIEGPHVVTIVGPDECVFWDNTVPHKWRALRDNTLIVTVRVK